jgi:hypothetical protein
MLENEPIDHFRVPGIHFQNHPVFDKAGKVGVQKNAGQHYFFSRLVIYTQTTCLRESLQPPSCAHPSLQRVHLQS